jgi:hypothetical protein
MPSSTELKIVFLFLFWLNFLQGLFAFEPHQDTVQLKNKKLFHNFLQIGILGSHYSVRDISTSPLIYSGMQTGAHLGFLMYSERIKYNLDYNFLYGHLTTRNYPDNDANRALSFCNYLDFSIQKRIYFTFESKWRFWAGADVSSIVNIRSNTKFNNASLNYEGFASIGPTFSIERILSLDAQQINLGLFRYPLKDREMKFVFTTLLPVVSEAYRPDYNVIDDFVGGKRKVVEMKRLSLVTLNKYVSSTCKIELFYYLHNRNMFKFGYNWNFYRYTPAFNPVVSVNGSLTFSIIFRFNNK